MLTQNHAAPRTAVARTEPDSGARYQRRDHRDCRRGGLVDEALRIARFPLLISHHVRGGLLASVADCAPRGRLCGFSRTVQLARSLLGPLNLRDSGAGWM